MTAMPDGAMPEEPSFVREDLREAFAALEVMPGFRAELIDGEIIVSPTPDGQHETIVVAIYDWLRDTHDLRLHSNLTLISPEGEYVPDGIAAPKGTFAGRDWHSKPDGVVMVVEVTSGRRGDRKGAERDRGPKRQGYAAADIPLYLLIDRLEGKATIFSEPRGNEYTHSASVAFGEDLPIPTPLESVLPTDEFF
ncbi:Uma2 family endonuclease [Actinomadura decatromicini]|uniref:Uma2 family endonuclease n=1 Tax=Actinomadura decatromicini TaxID=2604572 RepID=A0A5D3FY64_9ACTN|nr:Uma2 family endonuclease [Actinomadura decatromicini]TYK52962.1 Uma2 family endonuclease [Actinomadura decatromicini]